MSGTHPPSGRQPGADEAVTSEAVTSEAVTNEAVTNEAVTNEAVSGKPAPNLVLPAGVGVGVPTRPKQWPALDGIRGIGVVLIFFYHWSFNNNPQPEGGWLSVDMFFVLSGFLITTLLLGEWDKRGRIDFKAFYARRALRLLPALSLLLPATVIATALVPQVRSQLHDTLVALPYVMFYVVNWLRASSPNGGNAGMFIQTWSLAVEEQFYLVWPTIFVLIVRRTRRRDLVAAVLVVLAAAEALWRQLLVHFGANLDRIYNATDTHSDGLMLGAALAFWLVSERRGGRWLAVERRVLRATTWVATATLVVLLARANYFNLRDMVIGISLTNIATAVLIWGLVVDPPRILAGLLGLRPCRWLGRRSYGLYLWQWPVIYGSDFFAVHGWGQVVVRDLIRTVLTFGIAAASYRFWETRFLRKKVRFQASEATPDLREAPGAQAPLPLAQP